MIGNAVGKTTEHGTFDVKRAGGAGSSSYFDANFVGARFAVRQRGWVFASNAPTECNGASPKSTTSPSHRNWPKVCKIG